MNTELLIVRRNVRENTDQLNDVEDKVEEIENGLSFQTNAVYELKKDTADMSKQLSDLKQLSSSHQNEREYNFL